MFKRLKSRAVIRAFLVGAGTITIGGVYQNCSRVSIVTAHTIQSPIAASASAPTPIVSMSENYVMTTLNHAVTVKVDNGLSNSSISFSETSILTSTDTGSGIATLNPSNKTLTFTPKIGFRGNVSTTLYSTQAAVTNIQTLTFVVSDPVLSFRPALAVRGPECILCHATIQGDLISDFGFKSATETGPDLFLTADNSQDSWISAFGIADSAESSLATATIVGTLAIPKMNLATIDPSINRAWFPLQIPASAGAPTPTPVPAQFVLPNPFAETPSITSFAGFIAARKQTPTNTGFSGVSELNTMYIGAPTAAAILAAAQMPAGSQTNFFKNSVTDPDLSGLSHVQTDGRLDYFTNSSTAPLVCNGDLFVDGVVLLQNVQVQSTLGCRIYATHSVFIQGPIGYSNQTALTNIEISSAVGVFMGFGYCTDCVNAASQGYANQNTLQARLNIIKYEDGAIKSFRNSSFDDEVARVMADYSLTSDTPTTLPPAPSTSVNAATYYANYFAKQNLIVNQYDATDSFINQGKTTFSRVLLNGPIVMSRYAGDFQGIIIAEFALWRLGTFTFEFDPVFTGVSLLPFLDFSTVLNIPTN